MIQFVIHVYYIVHTQIKKKTNAETETLLHLKYAEHKKSKT